MQVKITGKDIDLGEALQAHVAERMNEGVGKYFGRPAEAQAIFSREAHFLRCDCVVHLSSGIILNAQGEGGEAYGAFEDSLAKLEKRVRRYKRRLKNHHNDHKDPLPAESAPAYVLAPLPDETDAADDDGSFDDEASNPIVVAE
ncbi:MAG: ribosome-associated translation inhibitor RaiA, partial [Pseudomonadota bacterium]